jgi:hypothetical protein
MNQAFSAKRQASMKKGTPWRRQISLAARMLAMLTGCPPPELLVTVIIARGTLPGFRAGFLQRHPGRCCL